MPTPLKMRWESKVICYKDIPSKNNPNHVALAEVLGSLLSNKGAESVGDVFTDADDVGKQWQGQPNFIVDGKPSIAENLCFIRLSKTGKGKLHKGKDGAMEASKLTTPGPGFFCLKATEHKMNCTVNSKFASDAGQIDMPRGNTEYDDNFLSLLATQVIKKTRQTPTNKADNHTIVFDPVGVKKDGWETWNGGFGSQSTRVMQSSSIANKTMECRSTVSFSGNQNFRFYIQFFLEVLNGTKGQAARIAWGNNEMSIVWRKGLPPALELMTFNKVTHTNEWQPWQVLTGAPNSKFEGDATVEVRRTGGRVVIDYDAGDFHGSWNFMTFEDMAYDNNKKMWKNSGSSVNAEWSEGTVNFRTYNVNMSFGMSLLLYNDRSNPLKPKAAKGVISRIAPSRFFIDTQGKKPIGIIKGWWSSQTQWDAKGFPRNTQWEVDATPLRLEPRGPLCFYYKITLKSSKDGIDTPCVNGIAIRYIPKWGEDEPDFLDISPSCVSGSYSSAEPGLMSGSTLNLTISRNQLELMAKEQEIDWRDYVGMRHPIEFMIRWQYDDYSYGAWTARFRGYIGDVSKGVKTANTWNMSVSCHDPIWRLQKPNSIIDGRFLPLDYNWASGQSVSYYATDAIKYIANVELGDDEAEQINGNGDTMRFLDNGHPPLISLNGDVAGWYPFLNPITEDGFTFMPPYRSDSLSWMSDLNKIDYTVTYYGYADGNGSGTEASGGDGSQVQWPVLITGRYPQIIAGRPTHFIPDSEYTPSDVNLILMSADTKERPEVSYNVVQQWAMKPEQGFPRPAMFVATEEIPAGEYNSPADSWRVTLQEDNDQLSVKTIPEAYVKLKAQQTLAEFRGKKMQSPSATFRGEPTIGWGDKLVFKMQKDGSDNNYSDPSIDLDGITGREPDGFLRTFRILSLRENYNFVGRNKAGSYTTTTDVAPLSKDGV